MNGFFAKKGGKWTALVAAAALFSTTALAAVTAANAPITMFSFVGKTPQEFADSLEKMPVDRATDFIDAWLQNCVESPETFEHRDYCAEPSLQRVLDLSARRKKRIACLNTLTPILESATGTRANSDRIESVIYVGSAFILSISGGIWGWTGRATLKAALQNLLARGYPNILETEGAESYNAVMGGAETGPLVHARTAMTSFHEALSRVIKWIVTVTMYTGTPLFIGSSLTGSSGGSSGVSVESLVALFGGPFDPFTPTATENITQSRKGIDGVDTTDKANALKNLKEWLDSREKMDASIRKSYLDFMKEDRAKEDSWLPNLHRAEARRSLHLHGYIFALKLLNDYEESRILAIREHVVHACDSINAIVANGKGPGIADAGIQILKRHEASTARPASPAEAGKSALNARVN